MITIKKFSVQLVKESSKKYDIIDRNIGSTSKAKEVFEQVLSMSDKPYEVFAMMTLDVKNNVTGVFEVTSGILDSSQVHPREVFQRAILQNAARIIIGHNHPSGDVQPSKDDINVTKRLVSAGELLGIKIVDHIIIGDKKCLSFREECLM